MTREAVEILLAWASKVDVQMQRAFAADYMDNAPRYMFDESLGAHFSDCKTMNSNMMRKMIEDFEEAYGK